MGWLLNDMLGWIERGIIWCINLFIQSIADLINTLLGLLPSMPSFPSGIVPTQVATWFQYGDYYFPFSYLLTVVGVVFGIWIVWIALAIPLRWAKAVRGNQ